MIIDYGGGNEDGAADADKTMVMNRLL